MHVRFAMAPKATPLRAMVPITLFMGLSLCGMWRSYARSLHSALSAADPHGRVRQLTIDANTCVDVDLVTKGRVLPAVVVECDGIETVVSDPVGAIGLFHRQVVHGDPLGDVAVDLSGAVSLRPPEIEGSLVL